MAHETYIKEVEGAETAVLFVHGFLGSTEHFERFINILDDTISVYNILLTGHGAGVREFGRASMEIWKNQISELVDELAAKYKNIYIVGHSMGTFFAMYGAVKYPEKIKGIFLLQSPLKICVKPAAAINTFRSFFDKFNDDTVAHAYKRAHSVKLGFRLWEYISWIPRYLELFKESKLSREIILKVDVPCGIFQSKKDELVSMKSLNYIPHKENINVYVLQNSAHFIYDEKDFLYLEDKFCEMLNINRK